jgi:hypothetical protein
MANKVPKHERVNASNRTKPSLSNDDLSIWTTW